MEKIQLGQIVQVLTGRQAGNYAIVIDLEGPRFVWIADGKSGSVMKPKKKNRKHIQPTHAIGLKVLGALKRGALTNADLRSDLNQYLEQKGVY